VAPVSVISNTPEDAPNPLLVNFSLAICVCDRQDRV
jgi:hypothetical protein